MLRCARSLCSTGEGQSRATNAALTGLAKRPSVRGEHADEAGDEAGDGVVHDSVPGCELLRGCARRMEAMWAASVAARAARRASHRRRRVWMMQAAPRLWARRVRSTLPRTQAWMVVAARQWAGMESWKGDGSSQGSRRKTGEAMGPKAMLAVAKISSA